jgi:hypothetical protein
MTYRSFIRSPRSEERLAANWSIPPGIEKEAFIRERLARLSRQLSVTYDWKDSLAGAVESWENPDIPSGYTYFAQFVAHDCVQSTMPTLALGLGGLPNRNHRSRILELDTIYGPGFDGCQHARHKSELTKDGASKFQFSRMQDTRIANASCPARDLPRSRGDRRPMVADDRNDNNAIVSQMAVLFMMLHNTIVDGFSEWSWRIPKQLSREASLYILARSVCIGVYRRLVAEDLMRRLLHPAIYARYATGSVRFLDQVDAERLPIEFPSTLRFGHSMVRPNYRFNDVYQRREELIDVLLTTSRGRPWRLPLDESWAISWSKFFPVGGSHPNLSRRIGPSFSADLLSDVVFGELDGTNCPGIAYRDLLQCTMSPHWSVPALVNLLRRLAPEFAGPSRLFDDAVYREAAIVKWLEASSASTGLEAADILELSRDFPLAAYVLFEAAHENAGRHLGILGSILIAEVVFKALHERTSEELLDTPHSDKAETIMTETDKIASMSDLIGFLGARNERASLMVSFV